LVVGTSLLVYPAAGLIDVVSPEVPKFIVDPKIPEGRAHPGIEFITEKASTGMKKFRDRVQSLK
jgi:NAD-dependent deacetylase